MKYAFKKEGRASRFRYGRCRCTDGVCATTSSAATASLRAAAISSSPDGTVIGGLTCYLGSQTIDCMSVLLNGMYLETSNASCPSPPPKQHGLQFFIIRSQDVCHVIDHHVACMAKTAAEANTEPAPLTAADIKAVSTYGRELSLRSLFKQGILPELPKFLRLKQPAAMTVS